MGSPVLFHERGLLNDYLDKRKKRIIKEIEDYHPTFLKDMDVESEYEIVLDKYFLEIPKLLVENIYSKEPREIEIRDSRNVLYIRKGRPVYKKGLHLEIVIPFLGESLLFNYGPSTQKGPKPRGKIENDSLILEYDIIDIDMEKFDYSPDLDAIQDYLSFVEIDVNRFNIWLEKKLPNLLLNRKTQSEKRNTFFDSLNIPIKKRKDIADIYKLPKKRKKITSIKNDIITPVPTQEYKLDILDYENILETITHMNIAMERSPSTFVKLKETDIRNMLLVFLNGLYEGQAFGEVFNSKGKTDILIREKDNNIFIAECKIWKGQSKIDSAIRQLFRYVTWRDTKTAILFFIKNKNFVDVLMKIKEAVPHNANYLKKFQFQKKYLQEQTIFSYIFKHPKDPKKDIYLTILAFHIAK